MPLQPQQTRGLSATWTKFRPAPRTIRWTLSTLIFVATILVYKPELRPGHHIAGSGFESLELGTSIALRGSFADPFFPLPTGPSAHLAPGYPLIVALIVKLFGVGAYGDYALQWLTTIVVGIQLALLPLLADYVALGSLVGGVAAAAWLAAKFPLLPWENDFAGLVIVALAFPMYKALRTSLTLWEIICTGILWGVLLLLTPTPLPILFVWLLLIAATRALSMRSAIVLAILPLVVIAPWLIRNYRVFHHPVFLRDNLGLELAISNNSCTEFSAALNRIVGGCFSQNHPNESLKEAERVAKLGEPAYNKMRLQEAERWIMQNRGRFLKLTAERFVAFWLPNASGNPFSPPPLYRWEWITDVFTLLSVPGLFLIWRRERCFAWVLVTWLMFFPLIYYLLQASLRYRRPILWATLLPGAYGLAAVMGLLSNSARPAQQASTSPQRRLKG
jgi:hypothetical protein